MGSGPASFPLISLVGWSVVIGGGSSRRPRPVPSVAPVGGRSASAEPRPRRTARSARPLLAAPCFRRTARRRASAVAGAPPPGRVGHRPARTSRRRGAPPGRGGPLAGAGWRAGRAGAGRLRPDGQPGRWRRACRRTASVAPPACARRRRTAGRRWATRPCHESAIRARQSSDAESLPGPDTANAGGP